MASVAFLAGVLVAALVAPDHAPDDVRSATAGPRAAAGRVIADEAAGAASDGEAGAAGEGAADAGGAPGAARATSGPAGPADGAATGESGPRRGSGPAAQGVTDTAIKIGFGIASTGPVGAIDPTIDYGDMRGFADGLIARWTREGVLPVHGRTIELVHREISVLSSEEQRAACVGWAQDDKVFAVVGPRRLMLGAAQCLTQEFDVPTIISEGLAEEEYRLGNLFSLFMTFTRTLRNFAHWAHEQGVLKGKPIGVYYPAATESSMRDDFIAVLEGFGYDVVAEVTTDSAAVGGPQDQLAAERFRAAGVEVAFLHVSLVPQKNFMKQAESQGYKPLYLQSDLFFATDPGLAKTLPPEQHDGALAMTSTRPWDESDPTRPKPPSALGEYCHEAYREHAGHAQEGKSLAESTLRLTCDNLTVALRALQAAGPDLTLESYIRGLETGLQREEMSYLSFVTYGPGRRTGVDDYQSMRWHAECTCWRVLHDFRPMPVE